MTRPKADALARIVYLAADMVPADVEALAAHAEAIADRQSEDGATLAYSPLSVAKLERIKAAAIAAPGECPECARVEALHGKPFANNWRTLCAEVDQLRAQIEAHDEPDRGPSPSPRVDGDGEHTRWHITNERLLEGYDGEFCDVYSGTLEVIKEVRLCDAKVIVRRVNGWDVLYDEVDRLREQVWDYETALKKAEALVLELGKAHDEPHAGLDREALEKLGEVARKAYGGSSIDIGKAVRAHVVANLRARVPDAVRRWQAQDHSAVLDAALPPPHEAADRGANELVRRVMMALVTPLEAAGAVVEAPTCGHCKRPMIRSWTCADASPRTDDDCDAKPVEAGADVLALVKAAIALADWLDDRRQTYKNDKERAFLDAQYCRTRLRGHVDDLSPETRAAVAEGRALVLAESGDVAALRNWSPNWQPLGAALKRATITDRADVEACLTKYDDVAPSEWKSGATVMAREFRALLTKGGDDG